jgi:hypothetical protein
LAQFDPMLVALADIGNLSTSLAYIIGFPLVMFRLFDEVPKRIVPVLGLGVLFVMFCGVSHLIDTLVTHQASYVAYLISGWQMVATGIISWAFVIAMMWATNKAGLRLVAEEGS